MKIQILFILFLCKTTGVDARVDQRDIIYNKAKKIYESQNYFTALDTIATQYKYETPDQNVQHFLEEIVLHTGTYYFNTYNDIELRKMNIPTTDLIMAKRNMYLKKYKHALERLKRIPKGNRLYPESLLVKGSIYHFEGQQEDAKNIWQQCALDAQEREKENDEKVKRYFAFIKETCIINIARAAFKSKDYSQAIRLYEDIPKASFKWPYILIEKAWAYYHLGDYNRSLGILMTYNSPLLESYFMPEAEVLKALNYFKLCLYDDALLVVEKYYNTFAPQSKTLASIIQNQKGALYFFELMFKPLSETEKEHRFYRNLITQVNKRVKFNLDTNTLYTLNAEIFREHELSDTKSLLKMKQDLEEQINHYVKFSLYDFINEIHKLSEEMFNIKLEILSIQRQSLYSDKNSKSKRGSISNITRSDYQEYWQFKNEFWADELGDYSFGLSSQCK